MATQNTLSVPPELMAEIKTAAQATDQTPDEWVAEVIKRQLEDSRWLSMLKQNESYAQAMDITEADVSNLVHQDRLERGR
jgi:DNA-binding transcriptional MocR family regulator